MFGIGPMELVLILVVGLLVLGPKRMPELARTLGRGLGEFRRTSNDLRQSLALDEIQNDLRDGIMGAGTIHKPVKKPDADDRPPQAGDDLAPGEDAPSDAAKVGDETSDEATEPTEATLGEAEVPSREAPHPGELPLDHDPHSHQADADDEPDSSGAPAASQAADNDLGTIPVGRTATAYRKAEQSSRTRPAKTSTPSTAPRDDDSESEDERG